MANSEYPSLIAYNDDYPNLLKNIIKVIKGIMKGKTNNTGTCTLTANTGTTTVQLSSGDLGPYSIILFMPTTATAATEFGAGTLYVSAIDALLYTFTITHVNGASTDRTFRYCIIG